VRPYILLPSSAFKYYWNMIIIVLLLYTATYMPYRTAFEDEATFGWFICDIVIDSLFVIDIFVNFLSAYEDADGMMQVQLHKIAMHYVKGWFFIDFIACVPF